MSVGLLRAVFLVSAAPLLLIALTAGGVLFPPRAGHAVEQAPSAADAELDATDDDRQELRRLLEAARHDETAVDRRPAVLGPATAAPVTLRDEDPETER